MSDFQIIKDAKIPLKRSAVYPFPNMEIGDAFDVPIWRQSAAMNSARYYGLVHGQTFVSRKVEAETVRIWRTA